MAALHRLRLHIHCLLRSGPLQRCPENRDFFATQLCEVATVRQARFPDCRCICDFAMRGQVEVGHQSKASLRAASTQPPRERYRPCRACRAAFAFQSAAAFRSAVIGRATREILESKRRGLATPRKPSEAPPARWSISLILSLLPIERVSAFCSRARDSRTCAISASSAARLQ